MNRNQSRSAARARTRSQIESVLNGAGLYRGMTARAASVPFGKENTRAKADDNGGFTWILTTEKPTIVWDWEQWDFVEEVLLADGMLVPATNQVVLLDSHMRQSVKDVLGHVEQFTEDKAGQFLARAGVVFFAGDQASMDAKQKVEGNHITDGSVGYQQNKSVWLDEGTTATIKGREFTGPLRVTYEWTLMEFSITPIGADVLAKVRDLQSLCGA